MVYSKKYFNLAKIYFEAIQNEGKSELSWLEQRSEIKFWWLRNSNYVKFTEEFRFTEKNV